MFSLLGSRNCGKEREREGQRDKRKHQDSYCGGARLPDGGDKWGAPGSVDHMETG